MLHERALELSDRNSAIALGVQSPMAKAAFEGYAEFAREYADEMFEALGEIVREGPRGTHLNHSRTLSTVRRKHAIWIPTATDSELNKLEDSIWKMAASAGYTTATADRGTDWYEQYNRAHREWSSLVGLPFQPLESSSEPPDNSQVEVNLQRIVMTELRRVLGTEDYSAIRTVAIGRALGNRE